MSISKKQILLKNKNYTLMNLGQRKPESPFKTPESCKKSVQYQRSPQTIKYFIGNGYQSKLKGDINGITKNSINQKNDNSSSSSSIKVQVKSPNFNKHFQYKNSKIYMNHRQPQQISPRSVFPSLKKKYQDIKIDFRSQEPEKQDQNRTFLTKAQQMRSIIEEIENYQNNNNNVPSFGNLHSKNDEQQDSFLSRQNRQNSIQNLYKRLQRMQRFEDTNDNSIKNTSKKQKTQKKQRQQQKRVPQKIQIYYRESSNNNKKYATSTSTISVNEQKQKQKEKQQQQTNFQYIKQFEIKDRKIQTLKNINERLQAQVFALQRSKIDLIKHNELLNQCLKTSDGKNNLNNFSGKNFQYRQVQNHQKHQNHRGYESKIAQKDQRQNKYIKLLQQQLQQRQFQVTNLNIKLQKLQLKMNAFDERQLKIRQEQSNKTKQQLSELTLSYERSIQILNQQIDELKSQNNQKQTAIQNLKTLIAQKDKVIREIHQLKAFVQEFKYEIVKKIKSETDLNNLSDIQVEESEIMQMIRKENIELKDKLFQMKKAQLMYLQRIKHLDTDMKNSRILFVKEELKLYQKEAKQNNSGLNRLATLQSHKLQLFKAKERKIEEVNGFFQKANQSIQFIIQREKIPIYEEPKQEITYKCKFSLVSSEKSLSEEKEI